MKFNIFSFMYKPIFVLRFRDNNILKIDVMPTPIYILYMVRLYVRLDKFNIDGYWVLNSFENNERKCYFELFGISFSLHCIKFACSDFSFRQYL